MEDLTTECILVFNLDNRNNVINFNRAAIGIVNMAVSTGREIFKTAILSNASSIILRQICKWLT
jgi:DNA repair protein RadC